MDRSTRYGRFFTSISTQDVDIDFDIGWQGGSFWIIVPDIDIFDVDIEKKRRYRRFCDDNIERKRRYRDNNVDINNLYISQLQLECVGTMSQFLSDMPDFLEDIEESLQRALEALPIPTPGPPQDGISILEQFR